MIVRTDKGLEERPGLSGHLPEKDRLVAVSYTSRRSSGRLIHQAMAGEANPGPEWAPPPASASDPPHHQIERRGRGEDRPNPHRSVGADQVRADSLVQAVEGLHSNKRVRVNHIRPAVRTIASRLKNAS